MVDVPAQHQRIDGGAEVVEVHDPQVPAAGGQEPVQQPGRGQRLGQVAVAGGVDAGQPIVTAEQAAVRGQPQRGALHEGADPLAVDPAAQRLADGAVRGVARHQPHRQPRAACALPVLALGQARLQERGARDRLDQPLDDAAHAGGHAARPAPPWPGGPRRERRARGARSRLPSGEPRSGRSATSPAAGAATTPATRFTSGPARSRSCSHARRRAASKPWLWSWASRAGSRRGQIVVQAGVRQTGRAGGGRRAR